MLAKDWTKKDVEAAIYCFDVRRESREGGPPG